MGLSLPSRPKIASLDFRLRVSSAFNPDRTGAHQRIFFAEPIWACSIGTTQLGRARAGEYEWLINELNDGQTVWVYNAERPYPLAYSGGGGWGAPQITAISRANRTLTLSGLAPGAIISRGDFGAWQDGPAARLFQLGGGVADGSGNLTVECQPPPPSTSTNLPAAFKLDKPAAEMMLLQSSAPFQAPRDKRVEMDLIQIIRRF